MSRYLTDSVCIVNWGGGVGVGKAQLSQLGAGWHDKVPPMIDGAMPLLNPR